MPAARAESPPWVAGRAFTLDPATGIVIALLVHVAAYYMIDWIDPPEVPELELIEFEVAALPPEPKPEPEPEKPKPEPKKPEPEPEIPDPPKKLEPPPKNKTKQPPKKEIPQPAAAPVKPRFTLPPSAMIPGTGNGVTVTPGDGTQTSGSNDGPDDGKGTKPGKGPGGEGTEPKPSGPPWAPKGDLYIAQQPRVKNVPEYECPAVSERQISGTVVLVVQVQRDGRVRSAKTSGKKVGFGCDEIARKALLAAKFSPAMGTDGKAADYELRYEYVFELHD